MTSQEGPPGRAVSNVSVSSSGGAREREKETKKGWAEGGGREQGGEGRNE